MTIRKYLSVMCNIRLQLLEQSEGSYFLTLQGIFKEAEFIFHFSLIHRKQQYILKMFIQLQVSLLKIPVVYLMHIFPHYFKHTNFEVI